MTFEGVISPLVTPFTPGGIQVDEAALRRLVDAQVADGVGGLVSCGTTGEFSSLSPEERRRVTEIVTSQAAGRVPVMVHTGSTSTAEAMELSLHAQAHGARGLLVAPPYYGSHTDHELVRYFQAISAAVDLPVCLYNIPAATGIGMSVDLMTALAEAIPGVRFVKDSSGDLEQQTRFLQDHADTLTYLCGEELLVAPGLLLGLDGAVLGCANLIAPGMVQLFKAGRRGDLAEMARINMALLPLMRFLISHPYAASVKEALHLVGLDVGPVREPLLPLGDLERQELALVIKAVEPTLLTSGAGHG